MFGIVIWAWNRIQSGLRGHVACEGLRTGDAVRRCLRFGLVVIGLLLDHLFVLSVVTESVPRIKQSERLATIEVAPNFWRATARYGFMERPDIPHLLKQTRAQGCSLDFDDVTFYVGHETFVHREDGKGLAAWEEALFAAMERNAVLVSDFFRLSERQRRRNWPTGCDLIFSAHAAEPQGRHVSSWRIPEMPHSASDGRSRFQSGPWKAVQAHVHEFTP
jgi:hypothetical protein